jgi:hypothetical protein
MPQRYTSQRQNGINDHYRVLFMSTYSFFDRDVVERAAKKMMDHKHDLNALGLSLELQVAIGWKEKTEEQIQAAFREAVLKVRRG